MQNWMINIVVYMLFCSFLHNITPGSQYIKYTKFLMGIIMLLIILQPISYLLSFQDGNTFSMYVNDLDLYLAQAKQNDEGYYDYYDMSLAKAGQEYLMAQEIKTENISITKDQNGNILKVTIYVKQELVSSHTDADIKKIISQFYNLDTERIYIVR